MYFKVRMYSFTSKETETAFQNWLKWLDGGYVHPFDIKEFHKFVMVFHNNKEQISKEQFCSIVKKHIHTSRTQNYGVVQKFYCQLEAIDCFLKSKERRFK